MSIFIGTALDGEAYGRDQASVLCQIGLLDMENLPIVGVETAMKVMDESSLESNQLIKSWKS